MQYGVCGLSAIPMRKEPADASEMVNQVLFGECFQVLEGNKKWAYIKLAHDTYEGWVDLKQIIPCTADYFEYNRSQNPVLSAELIDLVSQENPAEVFPVFLGSTLPFYSSKSEECKIADSTYGFNGETISGRRNREEMLQQAYKYLNAPYQWGGRTPAGIDCSGLTQMIYRLSGMAIPRDSGDQAQLGDTLSFIEESEPGDLAFFDNEEGRIIHVGILLQDNHILHAHGQVRIDSLDQSGIFNRQRNTHTHKLRVIKKLF